ncbi:BirA family biotin operon repressor/biotin-[acetyl-CoA-carboxylase] ligase [Salana multivorans]|uniref:biotin--[biotin carboxyl-carrier protein] ligase n=1 Tax=Salana multivorans TaxID=120377 RepID=A0A3N2D7N6_9MICO|nr:biotin--[acetyl-CoA-carboxylase] ligase [Salana multivorans]ROR95775.1 BirA family biotin operon repressor/biotin-[acetyl-CoA-carboxylase] ligase [Salana multivorans]
MADEVGLARLVVVEESPSTNDELTALRAADPAAWPHLSALVARHQSAGHGRLGRGWTTPPGQALTISVVVEPGPLPREEWPTLSLVAGLAAVRACERVVPGVDLGLKWPNDVVVVDPSAADDAVAPGWVGIRKVGGILAQAQPDAVILGVGINVCQRELPVPWATSLALAAGPVDDDAGAPSAPDPLALAGALGAELAPLVERWRAGGFAVLREEVAARLDTLGRRVSVELGGGRTLTGIAEALGADGRLVVRDGGTLHDVAAGDVAHLRAG